MTSGLHHITAITRKIQANVDFYVGFLGLRLVKRTAGFEDAAQLHLFYGDGHASPGSLITFLAWEDGSPGRVGHGAPSEIAFAVRPAAMGFWLTRSLQRGVPATGPSTEFGEPVLRLTDPDGIIVKLVGVEDWTAAEPWPASGISGEDSLRGLRAATILSEQVDATAGFLTRHMGFRNGGREGTTTRLLSDAGDALDIRDAGGFWPAAPGTGTIDHVAVRAIDRPAVEAVTAALVADGNDATNAHDRTYFYSLYVREPAGTLIEVATDGPGFMIDEDAGRLGEALFIPAHYRLPRDEVVPMLPQFGLPGQPRIVYRDLPFIHRIHEANDPDGSTLVLLHGTGGSEIDLLPFGRAIARRATLVGVRGRAMEDETLRFFRRLSDGSFDQSDVLSEAEAFAAFAEGAIAAYGIDPARLTFLGYSNGANMLAAIARLYPPLIRAAILLRPVNVLKDGSALDTGLGDILVVAGSSDPEQARSVALADRLRMAGATVDLETVDAGHELAAADRVVADVWLQARSRG